jgi:competence protein ComEA
LKWAQRLKRSAGAAHFVLICLLAATLLLARFRRPPQIVFSSTSLTKSEEGIISGNGSVEQFGFAELPILRNTAGVSKESTVDAAAVTDPIRIFVHVAGAVKKPGLYELEAGTRVHHAVEAAGGLSSSADPDKVNIALPVSDGMQVFIPTKQPAMQVSKGDTTKATKESSVTPVLEVLQEPVGRIDVTAQKPETEAVKEQLTAVKQDMIDINLASSIELEALPGIGPSLAGRIIEHRKVNGPFSSIEGLMDVSGIGPSKYAAVKDMVVVR